MLQLKPHAIMQQFMCGNKSVLYNNNFILVGRKYLNVFNIPIVLLHLLAVASICSFQFKFSFRVKPPKINFWTFLVGLSFILS